MELKGWNTWLESGGVLVQCLTLHLFPSPLPQNNKEVKTALSEIFLREKATLSDVGGTHNVRDWAWGFHMQSPHSSFYEFWSRPISIAKETLGKILNSRYQRPE